LLAKKIKASEFHPLQLKQLEEEYVYGLQTYVKEHAVDDFREAARLKSTPANTSPYQPNACKMCVQLK
jgi:hypothetical protein